MAAPTIIAPNMSGVDLFEATLNEFKATLTRDQLAGFKPCNHIELEIYTAQLQEAQRKRGFYRAMNRIRPFIDGLNGYSKIIELFTQAEKTVCFVWGPIKFLLQTVSSWQNGLDKLLDALVPIGDKLRIYQTLKPDALVLLQDYVQKMLVRVFGDLLNLVGTAMKTFSQKSLKQLLLFNYPTFNKELNDLLTRLRHDEELITTAVTITHFDQAVEAHRLAVEEFEQAKKRRQYDYLETLKKGLKPLFLSGPRLDFARDLVRDYSQTGQWLIQDPRFLQWADFNQNVPQVLAVLGKPGIGKTCASSIAFNYLEDRAASRNESHINVHIALSYLDGQHDDCLGALKSLLFYLASKKPSVTESILEDVGVDHFQKLTRLTLIEDQIDSFIGLEQALLVCDGLDELKNEIELKKFLQSIHRLTSSSPGLRVLLSCRPEDQIKSTLESWNATILRVTDEMVAQDIQAYVHDLSNYTVLIKKYHFSRTDAKSYLTSVCRQSEGMFLYAKLVLDELPYQANIVQVQDLINELPQGLDKAYLHSLKRVSRHRLSLREPAKRVFMFLVAAKRPLRDEELRQAIMIIPDMASFPSTFKFNGSFGELCGSLVQIAQDGALTLVHSSLHRYLLEFDDILGLRHPDIHIDTSSLCLQYICMDILYRGADSQITPEVYRSVLEGELTFLTYAARYCFDHLQTANITNINCPSGPIQTILKLLGKLIGQLTRWRERKWRASSMDYQVVISLENEISELQRDEKEAFPRYTRILGLLSKVSFHFIFDLNAILAEAGNKGTAIIAAKLLQQYGPLFRCLEPQCAAFWSGFTTKYDFDVHTEAHSRSYLCEVTHCPYHTIGFGNQAKLRQHINQSHGDENLCINSVAVLTRGFASDKSTESLYSLSNIHPEPISKTRIPADEHASVEMLEYALRAGQIELVLQYLARPDDELVRKLTAYPKYSCGLSDLLENLIIGNDYIWPPRSIMEFVFVFGNETIIEKAKELFMADIPWRVFHRLGYLIKSMIWANADAVSQLLKWNTDPSLSASVFYTDFNEGLRIKSEVVRVSLLGGAATNMRMILSEQPYIDRLDDLYLCVQPNPIYFWLAMSNNPAIERLFEGTNLFNRSQAKNFDEWGASIYFSPLFIAALRGCHNVIERYFSVDDNLRSNLNRGLEKPLELKKTEIRTILLTLMLFRSQTNAPMLLDTCKLLYNHGIRFHEVTAGELVVATALHTAKTWASLVLNNSFQFIRHAFDMLKCCLDLGVSPEGLDDALSFLVEAPTIQGKLRIAEQSFMLRKVMELGIVEKIGTKPRGGAFLLEDDQKLESLKGDIGSVAFKTLLRRWEVNSRIACHRFLKIFYSDYSIDGSLATSEDGYAILNDIDLLMTLWVRPIDGPQNDRGTVEDLKILYDGYKSNLTRPERLRVIDALISGSHEVALGFFATSSNWEDTTVNESSLTLSKNLKIPVIYNLNGELLISDRKTILDFELAHGNGSILNMMFTPITGPIQNEILRRNILITAIINRNQSIIKFISRNWSIDINLLFSLEIEYQQREGDLIPGGQRLSSWFTFSHLASWIGDSNAYKTLSEKQRSYHKEPIWPYITPSISPARKRGQSETSIFDAAIRNDHFSLIYLLRRLLVPSTDRATGLSEVFTKVLLSPTDEIFQESLKTCRILVAYDLWEGKFVPYDLGMIYIDAFRVIEASGVKLTRDNMAVGQAMASILELGVKPNHLRLLCSGLDRLYQKDFVEINTASDLVVQALRHGIAYDEMKFIDQPESRINNNELDLASMADGYIMKEIVPRNPIFLRGMLNIQESRRMSWLIYRRRKILWLLENFDRFTKKYPKEELHYTPALRAKPQLIDEIASMDIPIPEKMAGFEYMLAVHCGNRQVSGS